jgi:hypothetical protein
MDATFPDDPLSICGSQNEIKDYERTNPLSVGQKNCALHEILTQLFTTENRFLRRFQ